MRENLHSLFSGRLLACSLLFFTIHCLSNRVAAQNCTPDTEPPTLTKNHPLLMALNDGDTLTFQCGQQVLFSASNVTATDNCDPLPKVEFLESFQQGNCQSQDFILNMHCCWIAKDESGNSSQFCIQVVIKDFEPPVIGAVPGDLTVDLTAGDTIPAPASPSAIDGCFGVLQNVLTEVTFPDADSCGFALLRTWTATDNCGNVAAKTQLITVIESCIVCSLDFTNIVVQHTTCGLDNGKIVFDLDGVQGPIAYTWMPDVSNIFQAENIAADTYYIMVEDLSNGCKSDTTVTVNGSTAPVMQVVTTPESCAENDGTITINVTGGTGTITYEWSPAVSTNHSATGLNNGQTYSVSVTDEAGCTNSIADIAVGFDCDSSTVTPLPDIISLVFDCGLDSLLLCTYLNELAGSFDHLTICVPPAHGSLFPANDTCLLYVPNLGFEGEDSCCVLLCDNLGVCDTFYFEIFVEDCTGQIPCITLPYDFVTASVEDCDAKAKVCMAYGLGEIQLYDIFVDGALYDGPRENCAFDTIVGYSLAPIPGNVTDGPYTLLHWIVNGLTLSGQFQDVFEMAGLMNLLDPDGHWEVDSSTFSIVSFNASASYGTMTIIHQSTGDITTLNLNTTTTPSGSSFFLPMGKQEVVFVNRQFTFCTDTLTVEVICAPGKLPVARPDVDTASLNTPLVIDVLLNDDVNGTLTGIGVLVPAIHGQVEGNLDNTFTYRPNHDFCGSDKFTYFLCNENGCDEATVFITVRCDRIIVFNGFSPNNDGINDTFTIRGLENYPEHELLIYNRWGNEVFRAKDYQNNWDGKYGGNGLPSGTYFYKLDLGNGENRKGYVQLNR